MKPADQALQAARRRLLVAERRAHWRRTRAVTAVLLLLWFATSFATVFYARALAGLSIFGWPLSFYMAAQGASLIYLAIIGAYALLMRRIDLRFAARLQRPTREAPPHVL